MSQTPFTNGGGGWIYFENKKKNSKFFLYFFQNSFLSSLLFKQICGKLLDVDI